MTRSDTFGIAQPAPLAGPDRATRAGFAELDRSETVHRRLMADLACMQRVEAPAAAGLKPVLDFPLTIAAWNLERCYFPEASARLLQGEGADIVFLSEVDNGMARTGQRHTAADIAGLLGMSHAYGVEFLELDLGSERELVHCRDDFNEKGFHGNALLAATALQTPVLIRLDDHGHWFRPQSDEKRIGGRCAIAAAIPTAGGPLFGVSVHLESNADQHYRARQMQTLFDAVDSLAPGLPVVIGGDLNTGLATDGDFEREPFFADAIARGYARHSGGSDAPTTRASVISPNPTRQWKLDWFLTRGVTVSQSRIVPALSDDGRPLSDHELIAIELSGLAPARG